MLAHYSLKQNMSLCSKQSSLFSFYALPSGGKSKDTAVHCHLRSWRWVCCCGVVLLINCAFEGSENSRNVKKRVFKLKSENNKVALKQVLPKEGKYINIDWA